MMQLKNFNYLLTCSAAALLTLGACSEKDPVPPVVEETARVGIYILNSGNWNENNASLSFYDTEAATMTVNLFRTANGSGLGDSAEQILLYGSKIYITVTTSNRIVVLDSDHKLLESIRPEGEEPMNPRGMVAHGGKVYVSYFYGHAVAVLDTASLVVEKTVETGRYPEQLAVANGKLYVANSGGLDFETGYANTVSVVDVASFSVEKNIEVEMNPVGLAADSEGDVYVISMGDYAGVKSVLQRIDGRTGEVTAIGNASRMSLANGKLYYMYAQWDDPDTQFKVYDVLTEKIVGENFITDGTAISSPEALAVDPVSGKIYITEAPYGATSSLYVFSAEGKLEGSPIDTQGYYAKYLAFLR